MIPPMILREGSTGLRVNAFQPVKKCMLIIARLTKGAMHVARAAPFIPIPSGKMKT